MLYTSRIHRKVLARSSKLLNRSSTYDMATIEGGTARRIGLATSMVASLTVVAGIAMALPATAATGDNPPAPPKPGNSAWTGPAQAPQRVTGTTGEYGKTPRAGGQPGQVDLLSQWRSSFTIWLSSVTSRLSGISN